MSFAPSAPFGDYLVFVDESGDQSLAHINPQYPVFVLAFAIIRKADYTRHITPDLQTFKFGYWGHDEIVLHEHDIRKPSGSFAFLQERSVRERFLAELSGLMQSLPATIVAVVIDKVAFATRHSAETPGLAYDHAMQTGLDAVFRHLSALGQSNHTTPIIVECRGRKEDTALELAFRRFRTTTNSHGCVLPFDLVMIPKTSNSAGLQLADLIARPIGLHQLRPGQPNRAFDLIHPKLCRTPDGRVDGHGLIRMP
jgi:Protein of unknown function (DUF3800)